MSPVASDTVTCTSCDIQLWPGDRFCRRCGEAADVDSNTIYEIDLDRAEPDATNRTGGGGWKRLSIVLGLLALMAAVAIVLAIIGGSDGADDPASVDDPDRAGEQSSAQQDGGRTGSLTSDNPPERQAALDAFEAARARGSASIGDVFDLFDIDQKLLVLGRDEILRFDRFGQRDRENLGIQRLPSEWPYGALGHADIAGYRVNLTSRSIIDIWDAEFKRWSPATLTLTDSTLAAMPFSSLAVSPTHVAAEAGALVRFWSQGAESEVGRVAGRLIPSTGPGFVISECEPIDGFCALKLYDSKGVATGHVLEADLFTPDFDRPARISPDGSRIAFVSGNERIVWHLDDPNLALSRRSFGEEPIDVAWLPDGSTTVLLTSDGVIVQPVDRPSIRIAIDLEAAWGLGLVE